MNIDYTVDTTFCLSFSRRSSTVCPGANGEFHRSQGAISVPPEQVGSVVVLLIESGQRTKKRLSQLDI